MSQQDNREVDAEKNSPQQHDMEAAAHNQQYFNA